MSYIRVPIDPKVVKENMDGIAYSAADLFAACRKGDKAARILVVCWFICIATLLFPLLYFFICHG